MSAIDGAHLKLTRAQLRTMFAALNRYRLQHGFNRCLLPGFDFLGWPTLQSLAPGGRCPRRYTRRNPTPHSNLDCCHKSQAWRAYPLRFEPCAETGGATSVPGTLSIGPYPWRNPPACKGAL